MASYPSPYQVGSSFPTRTQSQTGNVADIVRAPGGVYEKAFSVSDETAFAIAASAQFDTLKQTNIYSKDPKMNDFQYLQALVRTAGLSKSRAPLGLANKEDTAAIKEVLKQSYLQGIDWNNWLTTYINSPYGASGKSTFSKDVSTALKQIDTTDAQSKLSNAYFQAFGVMPSDAQIEKFKNKFNTEARKQMASTTTTRAGGDVTKTKTVSSGEGFTEEEQAQFMADFLKTNYKITGKEESGQALNLFKSLEGAYKANMLPVPERDKLAAFVGDVIGTADANTAKQKIEAKIQTIRNVASKMYVGVADHLANGGDVIDVLEPVVKDINNRLGTNFAPTDERFRPIINYNDGKTTRTMNAIEIDNFMQQLPEYQTSPAGRDKYFAIGQAFKNALGG